MSVSLHLSLTSTTLLFEITVLQEAFNREFDEYQSHKDVWNHSECVHPLLGLLDSVLLSALEVGELALFDTACEWSGPERVLLLDSLDLLLIDDGSFLVIELWLAAEGKIFVFDAHALSSLGDRTTILPLTWEG